MRTLFRVVTFSLCVHGAAAQENTASQLRQIAEMNAALDRGGIDRLVDVSRREAWSAVEIPSQWHVEHISKPEQKPVDVAARSFGKALAVHLANEAEAMQRLPAAEPLRAATVRLLDLSEWCGAVEAYGNAFLAQRALDLAAVGMARLTANLDFPLEKVEALLARAQPSWMSLEAGVRILNRDAGAVIFTKPDQEEMQRIFGSGKRLLAEQRNPALLKDRQTSPYQWRLTETPAVKANLEFFEDDETWRRQAPTLVNQWDYKMHLAFTVGLELQNIRKVRALFEFRKRIGAFPEKPLFSATELRDRERGHAETAKLGIKVVNMEDTYESPMAAAFSLAWKRYLESEVTDVAKVPQQRSNLDAPAFQAYKEVRRGEFLDKDSRLIAEEQERKQGLRK